MEKTRGDHLASSRALEAFAWLALACFVFLAISDGIDDAYIVYRYVTRWLSGDGLTFNDHERVEGYTSLLWTLTLAALSWLTGLPAPVASILINVVVLLLTAAAIQMLLRTLGVGRPLRVAALALYATSYLYFRVAFLGLELAAYMLLVLVALALLIKALDRVRAGGGMGLLAAAGALGGALFASRPEGLFVVAGIWGWLVLFGYDRQRLSVRQLLALIVPGALVIAAVLTWRQASYGEWMPNSVVAKSFAITAPDSLEYLRRQVTDGLRYLAEAYAQQPAWPIAVVLAAILAWRRGLPHALVVLLAPIAVSQLIVLQNGGDWMPYHRFVTTNTPLLIVIAVFASAQLRAVAPRLAVVGLLAFSAAQVWPQVAAALEERAPVTELAGAASANRATWPYHHEDLQRMHSFVYSYARLGRALRPVWQPEDVLVAEAIGRVGYAAPQISIHDPMGLTDATLARDPEAFRSLWGRVNWRYTMSLNAAVIAIHHWPHQAQWHRFTPAYPDGYAFFDIGPRDDRDGEIPVYVMVRRDRLDRYGPPLRALGARQMSYAAIGALAMCRRSTTPVDCGEATATSRNGREGEFP